MQKFHTPPSSHVITTAEQLLNEALGGTVRLGVGDNLTSSGRASVYRLHVLVGPDSAPVSVIVKDAQKSPTWTFFNDWASLLFLSQVMPDMPFTPRFYAGDAAQGIFVMEDLGNGRRLDHLLLGNDPGTAETALVEHAALHGRLHALTIGKQAQYDHIRQPLGIVQNDDDVAFSWLASTFYEIVDFLGIKPIIGTDSDLAALAVSFQKPGPFHAFIQGDSCPDNCLYVGSLLYLLDFEGSRYAHALLEGAYGRIHFPTCWCVYRLPEHVLLRMDTTYRTELMKGCLAAADDTLFYNAFTEACTFWVLDSCRRVPLAKFLQTDRIIVAASDRQRLQTRIDTLVQMTEQYGHLEAIGAAMRSAATKLRTLWPETAEMPYYPAFRPL